MTEQLWRAGIATPEQLRDTPSVTAAAGLAEAGSASARSAPKSSLEARLGWAQTALRSESQDAENLGEEVKTHGGTQD